MTANTYKPEQITALYARLSQEDALDVDSNSIVNQKAVLTKYASDNGFTNPVFFIDDGVSGVTFDRPNFNRMIAEIEAGNVATVIVKDMSRLGRDYLKVGYYTEIFFVERDVRYIAINDGAVKRIFYLCVAGNGPMRIAKTLKADKVLTTRAHYAKQKELTEKVKEEQQKVDIIFNFVGEIHLPTDLQTEQKEATKQKKTA